MADLIEKGLHKARGGVVQFVEGKGHTLSSKVDHSNNLTFIADNMFSPKVARGNADTGIGEE